MNPSPVTKKTLLLFLFVSGLITVSQIVYIMTDNRTKIVFCDVGQGDAAYIRIQNKTDILVDAGPDRKILSCLGKYMPFYDRTVELAFLSHPQRDHFNGYLYVLNRYKIGLFLSNSQNDGKTYERLKKKLSDKKIPTKSLFARDKIMIGDVSMEVLWPEKTTLSNNLNDRSFILLFMQDTLKVLFTGDLDFSGKSISLKPVEILKVPHHGSKHGLTKALLLKTMPKIAVVSVGENNPYGHPSKEVLDLLKAQGVKIRRTDKEGNIIFKF